MTSRAAPQPPTRAELLARIADDPVLTRNLERMRDIEGGAHPDPGHDVEHALRVARMTLVIGADAVDEREAILSALLHDAVNVPKDHPDRARASALSADRAREWLSEDGLPDEAIDRITGAIRTHSWSRGEPPSSPLGEALQDADRLEALGVIGVFRCISTGVSMGADYFDASDPWAKDRALDDRRFSVDHFFTKLFRLPTTMRTERGKREAERRVEVMRGILTSLGAELGIAWPLPDHSESSVVDAQRTGRPPG